jgi:hypothetical protein
VIIGSGKIGPKWELSAAKDVLTAVLLPVEELVACDTDPPDCAATISGQRRGIEVTELVHSKTMKTSIKGLGQHFAWDLIDLHDELVGRVRRKDRPKNLTGGPYQRYVMVIVTDEMFLDRNTVGRFLEGLSFETRLITEGSLGLSCDPDVQACPVFKVARSFAARTFRLLYRNWPTAGNTRHRNQLPPVAQPSHRTPPNLQNP